MHSDHQDFCMSLRTRIPKNISKTKRKINLQKFMNLLVREDFNNKLKDILDDCAAGNFMKSAAKEVATEPVNVNNEWLERSRDLLMPIIKERNKFLHKAKLNGGHDEVLKQQCRDARSNVKNAVDCSKGK